MGVSLSTAGFEDPPRQAAEIFRAALSAMARPGQIQTIEPVGATPGLSPAAAALVLTLCDHETPIYLGADTDEAPVRDWISFHTGAPFASRAHAAFALGSWEALAPITDFPAGSTTYPDRSATLIVEVNALKEEGARLTGPGIEAAHRFCLPDHAAFQANHARFPQGCDFYFTSGCRLAGLPRSTRVEAAACMSR